MPDALPALPVIVIPGITATYLRDDYPLPPDHIWTVMTNDYHRATLHPDDLRFETVEPAQVRPGQVYEVVYKELIAELRYNLAARSDAPVPVHAFAYDWRQPLDHIEAQLEDFIEEVIARTKLLRHYNDAGYGQAPKVNIVAHSMGGLIAAGYLERRGARRVSKVVTLGTPFQGSFEAVVKVATGTADLGGSPPSSREREAARLTPALYHLLPSFSEGLSIPPDLPQSLFRPEVWQPSILGSLQEFIRLHGITPADREEQARRLFADLLATALVHRNRTDALDLGRVGLRAEDWLCVMGADTDTRVRLTVVERGGSADFEFSSDDRMNLWEKGLTPAERMKTGDGTVPLAGARPRFLPPEMLVCVTPGDFHYYEVQDRLLSKVSGFHGMLPNMDMLHRLIVRHFKGAPDPRGTTWGRPLPGIDAAEWRPPLALRARN